MARGGHVRGARQRKEWKSLGAGGIDATLSSAGNNLMVNNPFGEPCTILRIIGEVTVSFAVQTLVAGDAANITMGIGIVSSDAATVGSTAMPDPVSDPGFPWLWWYSTQLRNMSVTTESLFADGAGYARIRVESKAMRKVSPSESLVVVAEWTDINGAPIVNVDWAGARFLVGD